MEPETDRKRGEGEMLVFNPMRQRKILEKSYKQKNNPERELKLNVPPYPCHESPADTAHVLEDFLTQSTLPTSAPEGAWVLVQSPEDGIHGPELAKPIAPFTTGFENASPAALQTFVQSNVSETSTFPNFIGEISSHSFIVLDSRSATDGTCLFYYLYSHVPNGADDDEWDESKLVKEWMVWRLKFLTAWFVTAGFWHRADLMLEIFANGKDVYIDEHGVTQLPYLENDAYELPYLERRVSFPSRQEGHE